MSPSVRLRQALASELRARVGVARLNPVTISRSVDEMSAATIRRGLAGERDFTVYEVLQLARVLDTSYVELIAAAQQRMDVSRGE